MTKKIVVIGAGASGIAAATKLISNGFQNVKILEAQNRIGGRINTISYGSNVVDMGAQWCHGENDNVVFELANKYDLLGNFEMDTFQLIKSDGTVLPTEISDKLVKLFFSISDVYEEEMKLYKGSLGDFITEKYNSLLSDDKYKDIDAITAQQALDCFHKFENSLDASDSWYEASCEGNTKYWECDGNQSLNWKSKGYKTIFDLLTKKIPNPNERIHIENYIEFNKVVTKINWSDQLISIECLDGSKFEADHVICTVSLGVLKEKHERIFEPKLPAKKVNSINGLGFGTVDKIYLEFEEKFWPNDWLGFSVLWDDEKLAELRKSDYSWLEDVFGFYLFDNEQKVLCAWISGANARKMEIESDEEIQRRVMELLRMRLKKWSIPEPISIRISRWNSNEHFRGSYSYISLDTDKVNASAADLAEPVLNENNRPILQFAGEATNDHHFSTVHGAIETGWREADRIINFYTSAKL